MVTHQERTLETLWCGDFQGMECVHVVQLYQVEIALSWLGLCLQGPTRPPLMTGPSSGGHHSLWKHPPLQESAVGITWLLAFIQCRAAEHGGHPHSPP